VHSGSFAWNVDPNDGALGSYPSPLWVLVAMVAERLYLPVTLFCQNVDILAVLGTLALAAFFAPDRFAGWIPPLLLVASGGVATSAASGTETAFLMFCMTASFVSFERRWRRRFALSLALLVAVRPEGVLIAALFFAFALLERVRKTHQGAKMPLGMFVPALIVAIAAFQVPAPHGGSAYAWMLSDLFQPDEARLTNGLAYIYDAIVAAGTPLLIVIPIAALAFGRLSRMGLRTILLTVAWFALVTLQGGGSLAFSQAIVPVLPILFLAVQQGLLPLLDLQRKGVAVATWSAVVTCILLSGLASKFPGNLGPLKTVGLHERWMRATSEPGFGLDATLGRSGLDAEIKLSGQLRNLASFLRANMEPGQTLLTPWPGSLGYLSGLRVDDLFARTNAPEGVTPFPHWPPNPRADVVAALERSPDFILPGIVDRSIAAQPTRIAQRLMLLDQAPSTERIAAIESALDQYELITLPVPLAEGRSRRTRPFYLLRRRQLGHGPKIEVDVTDGRLRIDVFHPVEDGALMQGYPQLARLKVTAVDRNGETWYLTPTGFLSAEARVCARTGLLLRAIGDRPTRLLDLPRPTAPDGSRIVELRAVLLNPGMKGSHPFTRVSEETVLKL